MRTDLETHYKNLHFEEYIKRYGVDPRTINFSTKLRVNKIDSLIPSGKRLLELSVIYKMPWWERNNVTLADISQEPINFYKFPGKTFDFNNTFPFENESFDIIVAGEIIEHLYSNEFFVSEIYRILKKGGLLIGSTPNEHHLFKRIQIIFGKDTFGCGQHLRFFNKKNLTKILKTKFDKVKLYGYGIGELWPSLLSSNFIFKCEKFANSPPSNAHSATF